MQRLQDKKGAFFIGSHDIGHIENPALDGDILFNLRDVETAIQAICLLGAVALGHGIKHPSTCDTYWYPGTETTVTVFNHAGMCYANRNAPLAEDDYAYEEEGDEDDDYYESYANSAMLRFTLQPLAPADQIMALNVMQLGYLKRWLDSLAIGAEAA